MRPIPQKTRDKINSDPEYEKCMVAEYVKTPCEGCLTIDHTFIFAGRQVNELPFLISICSKHHGVNEFQDAGTEVAKDLRLWISLERAPDEMLNKYSKSTNLFMMCSRLRDKYDG